MKIAIAQLNYHIGHIAFNQQHILNTLAQAKQQAADLVVFAELAICGYSPQDMLNNDDFILQCEQAITSIAEHCIGIACIIGAPAKNTGAGRALFNAAYFLADGAVKQRIDKTLLPSYDVFEESRYFESGQNTQCINYQGKRIALSICEDLWFNAEPLLYKGPDPMEALALEKPDIMINIAASPYALKHPQERLSVLSAQAKKYQLTLLYVNQVGAHTDLIFDGNSLVFDAQGALLQQLHAFEEDFRYIDTDDLPAADIPAAEMPPMAEIEAALCLGIKDYFKKSGFKKAVLGLSGGIDSAVVCALACKALGAENVLAVLMPSKYSTDHALKDALDLVENLGCAHEIVPIELGMNSFDSMLQPLFKDRPFDLTEENIQARIRGILLMAISNKFGHIVLNTSNKSECAVGYGTLYGDMCGAIAVLGDVYKTQVFALARHMNAAGVCIPWNTITKAPSAELRPDQKDSDSLPDYEILDQILYHYLEEAHAAPSIKARGFDAALVDRILAMLQRAEFKRFQTAPILRVSKKAFGQGRRIPIVSRF